MNALAALVSEPTPDQAKVRALLDKASHDERVSLVRGLPRQLFRRLYDVVRATPAPFDMLVPKDAPPFAVTRHLGINSLVAFRTFEKPMYRDSQGTICGRNEQTFDPLVGPGYFTVKKDGAACLIDYTKLPGEKPSGWPTIISNSSRLSFFVFRNLKDTLCQVSTHVSVGRAARGGKDLGQFFILVRQDEAANA